MPDEGETMKLPILVAVLTVLISTAAQAQSFLGARLGDNEAAAMKAMGPSTEAAGAVDGMRSLTKGNSSSILCKGVVVEVQEKLGHSLDDFTFAASAAEAKFGQPGIWRVAHDRNGYGTFSILEVRWVQPYGSYRVSFFEAPNQPPQVIRAMSSGDEGCGT
jgi:hypothetical protein